ncbi:GntR family transcriptional regulator [Sporolactobacillus sp. THM7-7]|nr:GntR family transcriptional regulator [Sporolactobacillus sp. THM7-7]
MTINKVQYRKQGLALIYLAKKLFACNIGSKLDTIDSIAENSEFSRGTIQAALDLLKSSGAITTRSRGHLGTFLIDINYNKLLNYIDTKILICAMPLPYTKLYEGLGTGLYKAFENNSLNLSLAYVNGSLNRINGLKNNRFDFVVTSGLTGNYLIKKDSQLEVVKSLGYMTFLTEHVIIFRDGIEKKITDGMNIGVDHHSIDYILLTRQICLGKKVHFVDLLYNQTMKKIQDGSIDAAIWNKDEITEKNYSVSYIPINNEIIKRASEAVFVIRKDDAFVKKVVRSLIDTEHIVNIQKSVVDGKILPEY